jgi:hypothetical protein
MDTWMDQSAQMDTMFHNNTDAKTPLSIVIS